MYQVIYPILFILMIYVTPYQETGRLDLTLFSFIGLLVLILIQNHFFLRARFIKKETALTLTHLEILTFFGLSLFEFGFGSFFPIAFLFALVGCAIYLSVLMFFHIDANFVLSPYDATKYILKKSLKEIQVIFPFFIALLLIVLWGDFMDILPLDLALFSAIITFCVVAFIFPKLLIYLWGCPSLKEENLRSKLEKLCEKAHFSYADFRLWTILPNSLTAGIIGIFPKTRYILLTPRLIDTLSPEAILAVVAHEIGHGVRKHLLLLPLIASGPLLPLFFINIDSYSLLIVYALLTLLYLRFVGGFYLRLFERQVDLQGLELDVPLESMIEALNTIGLRSGNSHNVPSWHHFSIRERIDFLKQVQSDPSLAIRHHQRVRFWTSVYFILFFATIVFLYLRFP